MDSLRTQTSRWPQADQDGRILDTARNRSMIADYLSSSSEYLGISAVSSLPRSGPQGLCQLALANLFQYHGHDAAVQAAHAWAQQSPRGTGTLLLKTHGIHQDDRLTLDHAPSLTNLTGNELAGYVGIADRCLITDAVSNPAYIHIAFRGRRGLHSIGAARDLAYKHDAAGAFAIWSKILLCPWDDYGASWPAMIWGPLSDRMADSPVHAQAGRLIADIIDSTQGPADRIEPTSASTSMAAWDILTPLLLERVLAEDPRHGDDIMWQAIGESCGKALAHRNHS